MPDAPTTDETDRREADLAARLRTQLAELDRPSAGSSDPTALALTVLQWARARTAAGARRGALR